MYNDVFGDNTVAALLCGDSGRAGMWMGGCLVVGFVYDAVNDDDLLLTASYLSVFPSVLAFFLSNFFF